MYKVMLILLVLVCTLGCTIWAADAPATPSTPTPLPKTKINPKDGAEMVLIPAGEFLMGTSEEELAVWLNDNRDDKREMFTDEIPQHKVYLDAFYMYKTEVTVAQFRKFCAATKRDMPKEPDWKWQDTHPIVNVTWEESQAYAEWAGASLPTEAQWEKAARGGDRRIYIWGNAWPPSAMAGNLADETAGRHMGLYWNYFARYDDGYVNTAPVGSFIANPYGLFDLSGNVWEYCMDWYDTDYYKSAPLKNPTGPKIGETHVVRGSSWDFAVSKTLRPVFRGRRDLTDRYYNLGFRCAVRSPGL